MVDEIQELLRAGLIRASDIISRADVFDEEKALDRKYDWGEASFLKDTDTEWLNICYLDGHKRGVDELALIAIRGCSIEAESAKRLMDELSVIERRIKEPGGYSRDMLDSVRGALKCVSRLNVWMGRVDFSARAMPIYFHEKRISEINSGKGFRRNAGAAKYKEKIFDVIFECLDSGGQYDRWEDIITKYENQLLFDEVNRCFSKCNSRVQIVDIANLPDKIKSWARVDIKIKDMLDRVKSVLVRRNKK